MPEYIDLFEDGAHQAVRAVSSQRMQYIVSSVATAFTDETIDVLHKKTLLRLLADLNDAEIVVLVSFNLRIDKHALNKEYQSFGLNEFVSYASPRDVVDKSAIRGAWREKLVRLDLIRPIYAKEWPGDDGRRALDRETGMPAIRGYDLSRLGRLVPEYIEYSNAFSCFMRADVSEEID